MSRVLSEAQLRAQVRAVRDKVPDARVIGIHTSTPWTGPASLRVGGGDVDVAYCPSSLAVRERLVDRDPGTAPLIVLTDRTEAELGMEVLARFAKRRLFRVESWPVVMDLFAARKIDPRLTRESWIADLLIEQAPADGYPPVPSGMLDADTVWTVILCDYFGFTDPQPDARTLLLWTAAPDGLTRFDASPAEVRASVAERLATTAGSVGVAVMRAVEGGRGRDAIAVGLACRVLFAPERDHEPALREAAVRLEPILGGAVLNTQDGQRWAAAAEAVVEPGGVVAWLERADVLLRELRAEQFAYLSDVLGSGFEQRMERYASALDDVSTGEFKTTVPVLEISATEVFRHQQAQWRPDRAEGVRMSLRLARWLGQSPAMPASLVDAASAYAQDGGWVDRARSIIHDGDSLTKVSDAYRRLAARITERREQMNRRFAELLSEWTALGSDDPRLVPVESVLNRVVAPLAREAPILLVVLDGMSFGVFHELMSDLTQLGWVEAGEADAPVRRTALAALPSITEVSRASLLCGTLRMGAGAVEKEGFATCPDLVALSRSAFPPVLFHKADLVGADGVGLGANVRAEIERTARQVVGVVINAVDDHLAKGDQLRIAWSTESLRVLRWVLDAARDAGRVVVMTSDHGHVLERDLAYRPYDTGGLRYRADDGKPNADEIAVRGSRVLMPGGRVIAPWSERVRYGIRQNGYHGGVTPQEMVIPLAVMHANARPPRGWTELAPAAPAWWETGAAPAAVPESLRPSAPPRSPTPRRQAELFTSADASPTALDVASWIDRLLASPIFDAQKAQAGRVVLPDDRVRACLAALDQHGGKLTRAALAHALGVPLLRVGGLVTVLRRLLNVDGYSVLTLDETSDTVELNVPLLTIQFDL